MAKRAVQGFRLALERTPDKVRTLTATDLDLQPPEDYEGPDDEPAPDRLPEPEIGDDNEWYVRVLALLEQDYAGVILTGPPGTGKSYYAEQIGIKLAERDRSRLRRIQFHPSYQYEDFVEGYVPRKDGIGFRLARKHLLHMCYAADRRENGEKCVLIIDELSRADPARVFGEALTFIEKSRRGHPFHLASGRIASIPDNLVILATMNSLDRGVDEVDMALERRFAKIAMYPNSRELRRFLEANQLEASLRERILAFFVELQKNPQTRIGHTFFRGVRDVETLRMLWENQLQFTLKKAVQLNMEAFYGIERRWKAILGPEEITAAAAEIEVPIAPKIST